MKFTIYAEAHGTYIARVEAASFEEALEQASSEDVNWKLSDTPETGEVVEISCGTTWRIVKDGAFVKDEAP